MLKNKRILILALGLVLMLVLATGCSSTSTSTKSESTSSDAKPQKTYTLKFATTWPDSLPYQKAPVQFAEIINATSNGRLKVEVFPAGALMGAAEVLDAASTGTIDGYHDFAGYWMGKMPAAPFFASVPMYMEPFMHLSWVYEGGGLELWQKMYDQAGYKVKVLPVGIVHPELLAHANKPMSKIEDWKGLKYRTVGWWGEILKANGVSVTNLPAAELYPSLERGILDAAEFGTPWNNKVLGFTEITKYLTGPGMHQPSTLFSIGINNKVWNELPKDLQQLIESTARSVTLSMWVEDLDESMKVLAEFKASGQTTISVDQEVQKKLYDDTIALLDQRAKEQGGIFAEIWKSQKEYRQKFLEYEEFMMPIRIK